MSAKVSIFIELSIIIGRNPRIPLGMRRSVEKKHYVTTNRMP